MIHHLQYFCIVAVLLSNGLDDQIIGIISYTFRKIDQQLTRGTMDQTSRLQSSYHDVITQPIAL